FASSVPMGWFVTGAIAVQDIPEGALVSAPLACYGVGKWKSFFFGLLSGIVEAAAAFCGWFFLSAFSGFVPVALSFSAGAMVYVILVELLPDAMEGGMERLAAAGLVAGAATAAGIALLLAL
ncbi:MAG: ZIP family metal transporter, partial [Candidatus Micrarchaeota archaeon]